MLLDVTNGAFLIIQHQVSSIQHRASSIGLVKDRVMRRPLLKLGRQIYVKYRLFQRYGNGSIFVAPFTFKSEGTALGEHH